MGNNQARTFPNSAETAPRSPHVGEFEGSLRGRGDLTIVIFHFFGHSQKNFLDVTQEVSGNSDSLVSKGA